MTTEQLPLTAEAARAAGHVSYGRCRSGKRWFWFAYGYTYDYTGDAPHCDDPICDASLTGHEYGWDDDEAAALAAMHAAAGRLGGKPWFKGDPNGIGRASQAASILKKINAARRKARPPKPGASSAAAVEYLYEPYSWWGDEGDANKGVARLRIVRKTAKRVYYDKTDSRDRYEGVVTLGFVSRVELETDTRCGTLCPRDVPAGLVCEPHSREHQHCIHFGIPWDQLDRFHQARSCAVACPVDTLGWQCAKHGYTWDHCPHGDQSGRCWYGLPVGAAKLRGRGLYGGSSTVYTTLEAAEEWLYGWEREQERKRQEADPEIKRLRMEMADAHPDRGGTDEEFIAARARYERALREAS